MYPIYKVKLHNPTMHKLRSELALSASRFDPTRARRRKRRERMERGARNPRSFEPDKFILLIKA